MHPAEMTDHRVESPNQAPDALRRYLAETAQRELDELRAEFDVRLAALESALSRRDTRASLEHVVPASSPASAGDGRS